MVAMQMFCVPQNCPNPAQRTNTLPVFLFLAAGLATPVDLKLKLIPILQHMHHDASLASSSRQLLQQLVTSYPSTKMVIVTLHTFTLLAASSLVDIPKQVILANSFLQLKKLRFWLMLKINCDGYARMVASMCYIEKIPRKLLLLLFFFPSLIPFPDNSIEHMNPSL